MLSRLGVILVLSVFAESGHSASPQSPPYTEASPDAPHATLHGMVTPSMGTCPAADGRAICSARLTTVDGQVTADNSPDTRVEPGKRRLGLMCSYWRGGPIFIGKLGVSSSVVTVTLVAQEHFRIVAERTANGCSASLVHADTGTPVPIEPPETAAVFTTAPSQGASGRSRR
jgi:hypothetical protein